LGPHFPEAPLRIKQATHRQSVTTSINPGKLEKPHRVIRGGSWFHDAGTCRSASRDGYSPTDRRSYLGFRIAAVAAGK
jgi:formylglycine-generating enzyme required for sulfatase activity